MQFELCGHQVGHNGAPSRGPHLVLQDHAATDIRYGDYRNVMAIVYCGRGISQ